MKLPKVCFCWKRKFSSASFGPTDDVQRLFTEYSHNGFMDGDQMQKFLVEVQKEDVSTAQMKAQDILEEFRGHYPLFNRKGLDVDDFFRYLFSEGNSPLLSPKVHHDMSAPLSHYFIFTGHNSYLIGNQLNSDCSDVPIVKALQRGVRVIELDLWPNSKKDDIVVMHGGTMTTPVELIRCLKSIREHAFSVSPYPVIITFEDHLTADLQSKVAKMVTQTFGDMLFYPLFGSLQEFPSPQFLRYKVIISTKPPKEYLVAQSFEDTRPLKGRDLDADSWGNEILDIKDSVTVDRMSDFDSLDHLLVADDDDDQRMVHDLHKGTSDYRRIITIHANKPKGGLEDSLKVEPNKVGRLSLSELEMAKAAGSHSSDLIRFTQHNLLRIYPKGIRVDSSNYNPMLGWMCGAQLVALNMQGYGRSLWLMHGFFKANGGCGYIRKPDFLLRDGPNNNVFDPHEKLPVKKILKVKVYMGDGWQLDFKKTHFDRYSPPDFYTRVGIAGVPADTIMKRTRVIEDNWFPVWDEEFEFYLSVPELALLRIEVHEYDMSEMDDFGGQTCLPISELRPGIRAVPLCDRKGEQYRSVKLLMGFDFI